MTDHNPYAAPATFIADAPPIEIPADVSKKIKSAWIAACISGAVTLAVTLFAMSGNAMLGFTAWSLLDTGLIFGLAFGIYKKGRACAVLMLVYFVASKIILMIEAGKPSGLLVALIFGYYFWQGVVGTFAYQKLKAQANSAR
jgi:hypothetical protein